MYGLMRLGRDAEIRSTPSGEKVANLALVYAYGRKDANGERPSQWVDASFWGARAEMLAPYLTKGSMHLFSISDVHIEKYTGQNGEGYKLAGRVDDVTLTPKPRQEGQSPAPAPRPQQPAPKPSQGSGFDDMDNDIPY
jgi:single-strand DNA-binding protein